jgi:hypothetical protein
VSRRDALAVAAADDGLSFTASMLIPCSRRETS